MARASVRDFKTCINAGGNGRVDFGDVLNQGTSNFSVSFWIKSDLKLNSGSAGIMVGKRAGVGTTAQVGWNIYGATFGSSRIGVQISDGTTAVTKVGTMGTIQPNRWHFITVTFDRAGSLSIYIDGVLDVSQSIAGIAGTITNAVAMRMFQDSGNNNQFRGAMDELRFYSRVLTQAEITAIYSLNRFPASVITGEWLFLDGGGTTVADTSGNGLTGTFGGSPLFSDQPPMRARVQNRNINYSLQFKGGTDQVDIATLNDLSAYTELTFEFWIKCTYGQNAVVFGNTGNNATTGFAVRIFTDGRVYLYHASSNTSYSFPFDQGWVHVAGKIVKGSSLQLYVDGIPVAKATGLSSVSLQASTNTVRIGGARGSAAFTGLMTRVNMWNRALTDAEIYAMWRSGVRGKTGLVGEWMMDEGSGSTATDTSGAGNNGTITGATYVTTSPMKTRNATVYSSRVQNREFGTSLYGKSGTCKTTAAGVSSDQVAGLSCAFWLQNKIATGEVLMAFFLNAGSLNGTRISIETGTRKLFVFTNDTGGTGHTLIKPSNPFPQGGWHHVVFTTIWDQANLVTGSIYVDGVLWGTGTYAGNIRATDSFDTQGNAADADLFDDVQVYGRVLSAAEILQLYISGNSPTDKKIWWKFDEGSGSSATDSSGNGVTGTITTSTYRTDVPMKARNAA